MCKGLLLLGSGGHAMTMLQTLIKTIAPEKLGLIDPVASIGERVLGVPVIGRDEDLPRLFTEGWRQAALGVGSVEDTRLRQRLARLLTDIGFDAPAIVDPDARVGAEVTLGDGCFVNVSVVLQPRARVGKWAILNTGCIVEHTCVVGDFAHIASGAVLLGSVSVGLGTLVGGGSVVRQGVTIGRDTVVGAGSVVVRDLPDRCVAYGNPCTVKRMI